MPAGLQCWDASGNLIFDATYRVMRIIDEVRLQKGYSSSLTDERLKQGGWVSFQPDFTCGDGYLSGGVIVPTFSIDGSTGTLTWQYAPMHNAQYDIYQDGTLFYGAS